MAQREVKEVKAYKTSDGKIFEGKKEAALEHQAHLDMAKAVEDIVDGEGWSGMSKGDVVDLILENADELAQILK